MNENNEIITMEDEKVAFILQKMRKAPDGSAGFWKVTARRLTVRCT